MMTMMMMVVVVVGQILSETCKVFIIIIIPLIIIFIIRLAIIVIVHQYQSIRSGGMDGTSAHGQSYLQQAPDNQKKPSRLDDLVKDGSVTLQGRPVSRSRTGGWKACMFIIGDELSERLAYYGIASNLITYMITILHQSLASAAKSTNNWAGVTLVIPIAGAFFGDAFVGRYWAIVVVSVIYVMGLVLLTLSVTLTTFRPALCTGTTCPEASPKQLGFFLFSLYLISLGTGGIKPCLEAFGADQFDEEDHNERKMKVSFFNWWYFGLCTGALLAFTVLVYIQDNISWGIGFGIPAIAMTLALATFLAGTKFYRHKRPDGSPLTSFIQVIVAAALKWKLPLPKDPDLLYEMHDKECVRLGRRKLRHTNQLTFLDKAATIGDATIHQCSWNLCTVTQVEEVKLLVRIMPIWLSMLVYGIVFSQTGTFFTKQGSTMDRHMGAHFEIPSASLQAFTTIVILILVPFYDCVLVPVTRRLRKIDRGITMLERIGIGLVLSALCMVGAAITERKRLIVARNHGLLDQPNATVPLSIFWLLPQYILMGMSDVFAIVGQQEFFYDQVPDSTRSFGMALYLCAMGVGSFLSSLLITIVDGVTGRRGSKIWFTSNINRGHLDYFYWLLAILSVVNFCVYILLAKLYGYKQVESLNSPISHQEGV